MKTLPLSQCNKSWDFKPLVAWPRTLPAMSWGSELLTGFDRDSGVAVDLAETGSLVEGFRACYASLTLAELSRLWSRTHPNPNWAEHLEELFRGYGLRWNDELRTTCAILAELPLAFQNWTSSKQLSVRDLAPLRALAERSQALELGTTLVASKLSKSEAVQALEWAVELLLMDRSWEEIRPSTAIADSRWLSSLKALRFPQMTSGDRQQQQAVARLAWPPRTSGHWLRQGDKAVLDVRLQADSLEEFRGQLRGLQKIEASLKDQEVLWKK